jgi:hypothetical protein
MVKETKSVLLPFQLYKKIEEAIKKTGDETVSGYVTRILEGSLPKEQEGGEGLSKEEEDKVREKLKALGYMD